MKFNVFDPDSKWIGLIDATDAGEALIHARSHFYMNRASFVKEKLPFHYQGALSEKLENIEQWAVQGLAISPYLILEMAHEIEKLHDDLVHYKTKSQVLSDFISQDQKAEAETKCREILFKMKEKK